MSPYVECFVERLQDAEDDLKREVDEQQRRMPVPCSPRPHMV